jgi:hypothetical protein
MSKRTIAMLGLLILFALSLLGAQVAGINGSAFTSVGHQAAVIGDAPGIILAGDEPAPPPACPAPCGGG